MVPPSRGYTEPVEISATLLLRGEYPADAPVRRALSLALPDAQEDRRSALALLAVAPDDEQVADHRSSLEALREGLD